MEEYVPKFSVIIPAYNAEKYIRETLDSAFSQTYRDFEILVVNDGSTDKTLDLLGSYGNQIRIIDQKNAGVSAARNNGVKAASGEFIAFLDADDLWMPDKLFLQNAKLEEGYELAYTNRSYFGIVGDLPEKQSDICDMPEGDIWEALLFNNVITTSSVVVKKNFYEEFSGFDEGMSYCEDWDLWIRFSEKCLVGYNPEPLVQYRVHFTGLSSNYKYMSLMRKKVIQAAFNRERGQHLPAMKRRKILANTWSCSAWEAARCKDYFLSARLYGKSLFIWPFYGSTWYDVGRLISGRI
jgi:glycosyltransferase involved in cell wall biosynthesis